MGWCCPPPPSLHENDSVQLTDPDENERVQQTDPRENERVQQIGPGENESLQQTDPGVELNSSENVYDSHVDDTPGNDDISFEVVDGASGVKVCKLSFAFVCDQ